ncbi:unnamed protein product [Aphanomyces euteiches]
MEPVTVSQRLQYALKVQGGEMTVDQVAKLSKRSPNAVYALITNVDNLKRLVEAGFGGTTSTRHIPGARAVEMSLSQKPAKRSTPVRNHRPLPSDVLGVMDWLRSCPPRSVTTNPLVVVMEADIADFKNKTIQAKKSGRSGSLNNDLANRNTWNEQLAREVQEHEVVEAIEVNNNSIDAAHAVDNVYGGALDVEALTRFTKVTANVYKDNEFATGRNVCAQPRIRPNRQCDCWTLNNRYGLPQCDSLACVNVRENQGFNNATREASVEPIASRFGVGLRAANGLSPGTFIMEYVGEVIDNIECDTRLKTMIEVSSKRFIDATKFGNFSRFINHSCDPNASFEMWNKDGEMRAAIIAVHEIAPHEEITIDYNWWDSAIDFKCMCGTSVCKDNASSNES